MARSSYPIQLATSTILSTWVKTSREFAIAGRMLSSTGLPMGFGHRISVEEPALRSVIARGDDNRSLRLAWILTGSARRALTNARLLVSTEKPPREI